MPAGAAPAGMPARLPAWPPERRLYAGRGAAKRGQRSDIITRYAAVPPGNRPAHEGGNMCDQDHFETDRQEYEARGLVTRKQFGAMLGAGIAMMLPRAANAVTVTESDVTVTTPDGAADCYFVHPASGTAAGCPDVAGYLRAAAGVPADGQAAGRIRVRGAGGQSVLPDEESSHGRGRRRYAHPASDAAGAYAERDHAHDRCQSVRGLAGRAGGGGQESKDRHAGVLHGRTDGVPDRGRRARPCGSRGHFPWRRTGDGSAEQPASAGGEDQGAVPGRDCGQRRCARRRRTRTS